MPVSRRSLELIYEFMQADAFSTAIREVAEEEIQERFSRLRNSIRQSNHHGAAILEGEIAAYEELTTVLQKYAQRYAPPERI